MSDRPFLGARAEDLWRRRINQVLRRAGWREDIIPFTGYGSETQVRVLARLVLRPGHASPIASAANELLGRRGWRNFLTAPLPRANVTLDIGGSQVELRTDRSGYVDVRVKNEGDLAPGWGQVTLSAGDSEVVPVPVMVVSDDVTFGIVSDIDDTVITTSLPRLFIAAWNTFVLTEQARQSVPGMARMYQKLLREHPGAPVIYVSTGAWNTFPFLNRFLERHGYPAGPMLLTDWGPTNTGWFRSGPDHKRTSLRELARDFPKIQWVLVGDNGQHDPMLYGEFSELQPEHVRLIAIRELSPTEQILSHGTTAVLRDADHVQWHPDMAPEVQAPDGDALLPIVQTALDETEGRKPEVVSAS